MLLISPCSLLCELQIVIFDTLNVGFSSLQLLKYLPKTAGLNAEFYPESVKAIIVVNAPTIFNILFAAVSPFLPEETKRKIRVTRGNGHAEISEFVTDPNQIPREHGGQAADKVNGSLPYLQLTNHPSSACALSVVY